METPRQRIGLSFTGAGLHFLGYGVLAALASALILPAAWGIFPMYRWAARNLRFTDGTRAEFQGRAAEVWALFAAGLAIGVLPQASRLAANPTTRSLLATVLPLALLPLSTAVWMAVLRYLVRSTVLSGEAFGRPLFGPGTAVSAHARVVVPGERRLAFSGSYAAYLGFTVLFIVSVYTVIGWAFVATAWMRWLCRHTSGEGLAFDFSGSGWSLLWRGFATLLGCLFILPIPWLMVWLTRWFAANTAMEIETATVG